jgi:hypothetical protein
MASLLSQYNQNKLDFSDALIGGLIKSLIAQKL